MKRRLTVVFALAALVLSGLPAAAQVRGGPNAPAAQESSTASDDLRMDRELPAAIEALKLDSPVSANTRIADPDLLDTEGPVQISVRLSSPSVALGGSAAAVTAEQDAFVADVLAIDSAATVIGSVQHVLNAVFVEVDGAAIEQIISIDSVQRVAKVAHYDHDLSETVPYIGGTAVQNELGFDGSGVRVAVLDSGIDYTHANLGGPGTAAAYEAAWGTGIGDAAQTTRDGLFPTDKVVDGYDFVGELWPTFSNTIAPDPDPIDFEGHGSHVADIIAGVDGVAPGADLVAVKVCSAVASSCNGVSLILGMEFAVVDAEVDIINMSLGSVYGQAFDDDLAAAVDGASALGVLTVASAGNSADKPYVTGTPGAAPTALSVAQTQVPSAELQLLDAGPITGILAEFQPWSVMPTSVVAGEIVVAPAGNADGCLPFAPGYFAGAVAIIDRGGCNFTLKAVNAEAAGAVATIIGLVAPGAPFAGGDGGDRPIDAPAYMVSQADSNAIKAQAGETLTIDPDNTLPLIGQLVGSSSRGPSMLSNLVKPEIGAPGASVSAIAGSGTDTGPFGGTSGAAPMVSGSAALLLQSAPSLTPAEAKARLINTGETDIDTDPFTGLAPISRIGGGEVRVDRAVSAGAAAWETDTLQGALSFGLIDATDNNTVAQKKVTVRNYTNQRITYTVDSSFRYANDEATNAIRINTPTRVVVQANSTASFNVGLQVRGGNLPDWVMNSGSGGANPALLTANEYDGYITLTDSRNGDNDIHLPWHALPRKAGDVSVSGSGLDYDVRNNGVGATTVEAYSLVAKSPDLPEGPFGGQAPTPDLRYVGYSTIPVPAGFCSAAESFLLLFAVNSWERQTHANAPALFEFDLDVDQDGTFDYAIFNADLSILSPSFNLSDGRNVVVAQNLATGAANAFFFTDHQTNSGNTVLTICAEQIGMNADNFFQPMDVIAFAGDLYFGGPGDATDVFTISPLGEQYLGVFADGNVGATNIASRTTVGLEVVDFGPLTNDTETGLLLLHRDGADEDNEATIIEP